MELGLLATREVVTVHVDPVFPPIPDRRFDWSARFDNYDVCQDPDCDCWAAADNAVGHGATAAEALNDLLETHLERSE